MAGTRFRQEAFPFLLLMPLLFAGCRNQSSEGVEPRTELTVLAAASLSEAFEEIGRAYAEAVDRQDHRRTRIRFNFAGSQIIAAEIRAGIVADFVATANASIMDALQSAGLVLTPRIFAKNRMVWVVRRDGSISATDSMAKTLRNPRIRLVLAAPDVPAGLYAQEILQKLKLLETARDRLVSEELDVKGVLAKVGLAGADIGLVYATDVTSDWAARVVPIELPETAQVRSTYEIARIARSPGKQPSPGFLEYLEQPRARRILAEHGFALP